MSGGEALVQDAIRSHVEQGTLAPDVAERTLETVMSGEGDARADRRVPGRIANPRRRRPRSSRRASA